MNVKPKDKTDGRVYFRRPGSLKIYAVLSMRKISELRDVKRLENYLKARRESGEIIEIS